MEVLDSPLGSITSPAMDSWLGLQYQVWIPSYWVGIKYY